MNRASSSCIAELSVFRRHFCETILLISATVFGLPEAAVAQLNFDEFFQSRRVQVSRDAILRAARPIDWSSVEPLSFTPNDPYFSTGNPAGFPGQWHLDTQTSGALYDVNIAEAWSRGLTGQGVTIGIVDSGIEYTHEDLSPNYVAADSYDFADEDADPSPDGDFERHGTAVAGFAAARGGNGIGVTGSAPHANLASLRAFVGGTLSDDQALVDATLYHSSGGNTNIRVKSHSYIFYRSMPAHANAIVSSTDAGTIHVFGAGNNRFDANAAHMQSLAENIVVAGLGSNGVFTNYSNYGASVMATAPSGDGDNVFDLTTTDRTGLDAETGGYNRVAGGSDGDAFPDLDYTSSFSGTSAAAPLVAGIMALGVEAQPHLNTRFAKHLLARTNVLVDPLDSSSEGGWLTNGAGYEFNPNYGFGLIDADAFTAEAVRFLGVTPLVTEILETQLVERTVPDADYIYETFVLTGQDPLEEIEIHLDIADTSGVGNLEAYLVSPSGMTSRLMTAGGFDLDIDWALTSNAFWGEIPAGEWQLYVGDVFESDGFDGTWNSYSVRARMGSLIPEPSSATMALFGLLAVIQSQRRRRHRSAV